MLHSLGADTVSCACWDMTRPESNPSATLLLIPLNACPSAPFMETREVVHRHISFARRFSRLAASLVHFTEPRERRLRLEAGTVYA